MDKETFERILNRERNARKEAEKIMEQKSLELFMVNESLSALNVNLEKEIVVRTNEIKKNADQLNILFNKNPFPVIVYDSDTLKILDINATAIGKYKYQKAIFLEKSVYDLHSTSEKNNVENYLRDSILLASSSSNWQHLDANGNCFDVLITSNAISYNDIPSRIAIIEDVTEKNRLLREKDLQKQKFQDFIEKSSDFIYRVNSEGRFTYMNPAGIKLSGYTESEILTMKFSDLIAPDHLGQVSRFYKLQVEQQIQTTYSEFSIITKDGKEYWMGQNVESSEFIENSEVVYNATARNITDRKKLEKELVRSEEKFRSIIENMELGLLEVDVNGLITKAYPKFCLLTGYSAVELEGGKGQFLLDEEGLAVMNAQTNDRKSGITNLYEIQLVRKDGTKIWVMISAAPFYDAQSKVKGSVGIHLDITKRKALETELIQSKTHTEKLLKSKEIFIANVSHEIRTPLNAIIGITELMLSSVNDQVLIDQLGHVSHAGKGLLNLINELLFVSKIDADKFFLNPTSYSLANCLQSNFDLHKNKALKKDLNYSIHLNIPDNCTYNFDSLKLGQVIQNLLSNSLKFTKTGKIELEANLISSSADTDIIEFKIIDTGIGIPSGNLESIFNNFEQANNNENGEYGGTGLGLSIVKKILKLMGSEITVESQNERTQFSFQLKLSRDLESAVLSASRAEENISLAGIKILVAEDNMANKFLIESLLSKLNVSFSIVDNGLMAIEFLKSNSVDIVLMDMRMPIMNGVDATKAIRKSNLHDNKPIIALTANADQKNRSICLSAGMDDFLTKPYSISQLYSKIKINLGEDGYIPVEPHFIDEDDDFQNKMSKLFIDESNLRLVKLKEAARKSEFETISNICHSMRPSLLHLGQNSLIEKVKNIEAGINLTVNSNSFITELETYLKELENIK
ncbi:MAG: PAS domain S-box-containing protein [Crocinitomix sp.]|jgi:PAS domain S-box-containing protein